MTQDVVYIVVFLIVLAILAPLMGRYMAAVFQGRRNLLSPMALPLERLIYRVCRIDEKEEMTWKAYVGDFLCFSGISLAALCSFRSSRGACRSTLKGSGRSGGTPQSIRLSPS